MAKKLFSVDGISVKVDERVFNDYEYMKLQTISNKPLPDPKDSSYQEEAYKANEAAFKCIDMVFGKEKDKILNLIRKKNDGYCSVPYIWEFIGKIIEQSDVAKK